MRASRRAKLNLDEAVKKAGYSKGVIHRWLNDGGTPKRDSAVNVVNAIRAQAVEKNRLPDLENETITELEAKAHDARGLLRAFRDAPTDSSQPASAGQENDRGVVAAVSWLLSKSLPPV
jgi:hypothetical protein